MFVEEVLPPGENAALAAGRGQDLGADRHRRAPDRPPGVRRPAAASRRRHPPARHLPLRRLARGARRSPPWPRPPASASRRTTRWGPIAGAAALHFAVSTPNHVIQEEMVGAVPWYYDVVQGPIRMVDGFWQVPEAPGPRRRGRRGRPGAAPPVQARGPPRRQRCARRRHRWSTGEPANHRGPRRRRRYADGGKVHGAVVAKLGALILAGQLPAGRDAADRRTTSPPTSA